MLPTFVIGLREGLEAALIVGIVAAFLKGHGSRSDLRRMWIGVAAAITLCVAVGITLEQVSEGLPQRQQEMLECVIAVVAVAMVTFMILWMRTNARSIKKNLEGAASSALAAGSSWALVAMAFLAVLREGFETSVFLLAALQNSASGFGPLGGALLGIALAVVLGWFIYRGALRFNMGKFFTVTSVFLVLVAAGLVMKTFRAAFEAGWLAIGQQPTFDVSTVIARGSVGEAILGGVFGLQAQPVLIEALAYLAYAVPMLIVVLAPPRLTANVTMRRRILGAGALACLAIVGTGLLFAPTPAPASPTVSTASTATGSTTGVHLSALSATAATLDVGGATQQLAATGTVTIDGVSCTQYTGERSMPVTGSDRPATLTGEQIKDLRGRYPVGITEADAATEFPATYTDTTVTTLSIDPESHAVLAADTTIKRIATVTLPTGSQVVAGTVDEQRTGLSKAQASAAAAEAHAYADDAVAHEIWTQVVPLVGIILAILLAVGACRSRQASTPPPQDPTTPTPNPALASAAN